MEWRRLAAAERQGCRRASTIFGTAHRCPRGSIPQYRLALALALAAPSSGAHIEIDKAATRWESQWGYSLAWP